MHFTRVSAERTSLSEDYLFAMRATNETRVKKRYRIIERRCGGLALLLFWRCLLRLENLDWLEDLIMIYDTYLVEVSSLRYLCEV